MRHEATVSMVRVRVGPLSGVEAGQLARAYPVACAGTAAEGSKLVIDAAPVRVRCRLCGAESAAQPSRLLCAACGAWQTELVAGDELMLISVGLNLPPAAPRGSLPRAGPRMVTAPGANDV